MLVGHLCCCQVVSCHKLMLPIMSPSADVLAGPWAADDVTLHVSCHGLLLLRGLQLKLA